VRLPLLRNCSAIDIAYNTLLLRLDMGQIRFVPGRNYSITVGENPLLCIAPGTFDNVTAGA
jgi:hypothetical protein